MLGAVQRLIDQELSMKGISLRTLILALRQEANADAKRRRSVTHTSPLRQIVTAYNKPTSEGTHCTHSVNAQRWRRSRARNGVMWRVHCRIQPSSSASRVNSPKTCLGEPRHPNHFDLS